MSSHHATSAHSTKLPVKQPITISLPVHDFSNAKISQLHDASFWYEYILGFDVSVEDFTIVYVFYRETYLYKHVQYLQQKKLLSHDYGCKGCWEWEVFSVTLFS